MKCQYCDKTFYLKGNLQAHELIHTKEKPYKPYACQYCDKSFKQKGSLQKHELIHTEENSHNVEISKHLE